MDPALIKKQASKPRLIVSKWEECFAMQLKLAKFPTPKREYKFHPTRKWRFDFCYPDQKIAIEVEGLRHNGVSRHTHIQGYTKDCEKYNEALLLGYKVLRITQKHVKSGEGLNWLEKLLK